MSVVYESEPVSQKGRYVVQWWSPFSSRWVAATQGPFDSLDEARRSSDVWRDYMNIRARVVDTQGPTP